MDPTLERFVVTYFFGRLLSVISTVDLLYYQTDKPRLCDSTCAPCHHISAISGLFWTNFYCNYLFVSDYRHDYRRSCQSGFIRTGPLARIEQTNFTWSKISIFRLQVCCNYNSLVEVWCCFNDRWMEQTNLSKIRTFGFRGCCYRIV